MLARTDGTTPHCGRTASEFFVDLGDVSLLRLTMNCPLTGPITRFGVALRSPAQLASIVDDALLAQDAHHTVEEPLARAFELIRRLTRN